MITFIGLDTDSFLPPSTVWLDTGQGPSGQLGFVNLIVLGPCPVSNQTVLGSRNESVSSPINVGFHSRPSVSVQYSIVGGLVERRSITKEL